MVFRPLAASFRNSSTLAVGPVVRHHRVAVVVHIHDQVLAHDCQADQSDICRLFHDLLQTLRTRKLALRLVGEALGESGAPAEIKGKAQLFQMPISLITCGADGRATDQSARHRKDPQLPVDILVLWTSENAVRAIPPIPTPRIRRTKNRNRPNRGQFPFPPRSANHPATCKSARSGSANDPARPSKPARCSGHKCLQ